MRDDGRTEPGTLVARWREEADVLRRRGAPGPAEALETAAEDLEERWRAWRLELLPVSAAAEECGLSVSHLHRLIRQGRLQDYGGEGVRLVRRGELPVDREDDPYPTPSFDQTERKGG